MHPGAFSLVLVRGLLAVVLLGVIWAALHDIASGESDPWMEIVAVVLCALALGLLGYGWLRSRRRPASGDPEAR